MHIRILDYKREYQRPFIPAILRGSLLQGMDFVFFYPEDLWVAEMVEVHPILYLLTQRSVAPYGSHSIDEGGISGKPQVRSKK